ncbi:hypothetical protein TTRE_0000832801 [Trichuris trichiura]|uniref:Uncharacterized protein n=1 Tax=Trichuris trichiura TaxID=36087 RepID=A0A077ZHY7_TRITR|nr:hypothetical protein TTRE_0000832801 [Trichuris trichiura]
MLNDSADIAEIDEVAEGAEVYVRCWRLQQAAKSYLRTDRKREFPGGVDRERKSQSADAVSSFCNSFVQTHEDDDLSPEGKFWNLIHCMDVISRAHEVAESFPPTAMARVFATALESLDGTYEFQLQVYDECKIGGKTSPVPDEPRMNELRETGINLSDVHKEPSEIDMLIGADIAGELNTGRIL